VANAIEVRNLTKRFPGVVALSHVDVVIRQGACHALCGENGAGKSTLGKIISGLYRPDEGEILFDGKKTNFHGPLDAMKAGIGIVHQELLFCENMSVAENLCLDSPPHNGPFVDNRSSRAIAKKWLDAIHAEIDPDTMVGLLPIGKQQLVQIAGAIGRGAKVLIFDEPTSSLSVKETQVLMDQIRKLKADGVTCVYVSHRLDEVFELCDDVTVLRDGKVVNTCSLEGLKHDDLVRMMIGREVDKSVGPVCSENLGDKLLEVKNLSSHGKFQGVSFEVRAGEIVGLAGLVGAGRTEIAEAIFGVDPNARGEVLIKGKLASHRTPISVMKRGLGLVPEDRKRQGLILLMNARENISLPTLDKTATAGFVRSPQERKNAKVFFDRMRVKAPTMDASSAGLSGGNQQKLVIAKWLAAKCDVLILDEPTRGVDVGAKAEIHDLVRELARDNKAVLVISSELPELLALCDRILVIRNGRQNGEVPSCEANEESLMRLMTGVETVSA